MLIKKRQLAGIRSVKAPQVPSVESLHHSAIDLQKIKQEAKVIREEAEKVLLESQKKLKEAEAKAKEIIQNTEAEAKKIKEKVYQETLQMATREADVMKNQARELLAKLFEVKRKALNQAHRQIINIALDLAGKILRYQASVDPNVLKAQVVEAIKKATTEADRVQVFVNPADLTHLQESLPELSKLFPSGIDIVPLPKESVDPGSCLVETKSGQLDASFSTQLGVLSKLVSHIEVKEPNVLIDDTVRTSTLKDQPEIYPEDTVQTTEGTIKEEVSIESISSNILSPEEKELAEELLGDEPLIQLPEDKLQFSFIPEDKESPGETNLQPETDILETHLTGAEIEEIIEIPEQFFKEAAEIQKTSQQSSKKFKLDMDDLPVRTQEETEELDEKTETPPISEAILESNEEPIFEYEEEDLVEEKEKELDIKNILKPKKKEPSKDSGISKIASEIEQNPEWKDLIQNEDEE